MKKNIIYILILFITCWACKKDQMTEVAELKVVVSNDTIVSADVSNVTNDNFIQYPKFNPDLTYGSVTDVDGNVYKTIQIGNQVWMAENLKTTRYNDGSPIFLGKGDMAGETDWFDLNNGAFCWYENNVENKWMGAIYNWHSVETGKLAPLGWHVPNNSEWEMLINSLGGDSSAALKLLSSGTNESGFTAIPSPLVCGWGFGPETSFWSDTPYLNPHASKPYAYYYFVGENIIVNKLNLFSDPQCYGYSVRCVKDNN